VEAHGAQATGGSFFEFPSGTANHSAGTRPEGFFWRERVQVDQRRGEILLQRSIGQGFTTTTPNWFAKLVSNRETLSEERRLKCGDKGLDHADR
jgi:hypothetical protein